MLFSRRVMVDRWRNAVAVDDRRSFPSTKVKRLIGSYRRMGCWPGETVCDPANGQQRG